MRPWPPGISTIPEIQSEGTTTGFRRIALARDIAIGGVDLCSAGCDGVVTPALITVLDAEKQIIAHAANLSTEGRGHAWICQHKVVQSSSIGGLGIAPCRRVADVAEQSRRRWWRWWELLVDVKGSRPAARQGGIAGTGHLTTCVVNWECETGCNGVGTQALATILETKESILVAQYRTHDRCHVVVIFEKGSRQGAARGGRLEPASKGEADWDRGQVGRSGRPAIEGC